MNAFLKLVLYLSVNLTEKNNSKLKINQKSNWREG